MGSSSSTRRVTIINEDDDFRLSDSVKMKIAGLDCQVSNQTEEPQKQAPVEPPKSNSDLMIHQDIIDIRMRHHEQIEKLEKQFNNLLKELQSHNDDLFKLATTHFECNVDRVNNKYLSRFKHLVICQEPEKNVESCFAENPSTPLSCIQQVREFCNCVENMRKQTWQSLG